MRLETLKWPAPDEIKRRAQAFAMLDAILSPEWEYRYYSFNSQWSKVQEMASVRNGNGDEVFLLFTTDGCIVKVFDHEDFSRNARWAGQLSKAESLAPAQYSDFFNEPAFSLGNITNVIWWDALHQKWFMALPEGDQVEVPELLIGLISNHPVKEYAEWAGEYYETEVSSNAVEHVIDLKPLTQKTVNQLNVIKLGDLADDIEEIGYPASR